jgi:hypothetical protein
MGEPAPRLPVTVVVGFPGSGKSTLIGHWLRMHPAGERWALLANASAIEPAGDAVLAPASHRPPPVPGAPAGAPAGRRVASGLYRIVGGCACCTAQASARSAIIELLRAGPWSRLVFELDGAAHPAALVDLLRSPPLDALLQVDGIVTVVDAARPGPFETEPMHPLARAQVEVAGRVVLNRAGRLADERRAALLRRLADAPPFGRIVDVTGDVTDDLTDVGLAPWRPGAGPPGASGGAGADPESSPAAAIDWRCPADVVFDRRRLQALVAPWPGRLPLSRGVGAFRTERDWYMWRLDDAGASWEACTYRLENRLQLVLDPPAQAPMSVASIDAALADARIAPTGDATHGSPGRDGVR